MLDFESPPVKQYPPLLCDDTPTPSTGVPAVPQYRQTSSEALLSITPPERTRHPDAPTANFVSPSACGVAEPPELDPPSPNSSEGLPKCPLDHQRDLPDGWRSVPVAHSMIKDMHHRLVRGESETHDIALEFLPVVGLDPLACEELNPRFSSMLNTAISHLAVMPVNTFRSYWPSMMQLLDFLEWQFLHKAETAANARGEGGTAEPETVARRVLAEVDAGLINLDR